MSRGNNHSNPLLPISDGATNVGDYFVIYATNCLLGSMSSVLRTTTLLHLLLMSLQYKEPSYHSRQDEDSAP